MWYKKLEFSSVSLFKQLSKQFIDKFTGAKITKKGKTFLKTTRQGKDESYMTYFARFRKIVLEKIKDTAQDELRV